jgi:hypothetical protein
MKVFEKNLIVTTVPDTMIIQSVNASGTTASAIAGFVNFSGSLTIVVATRVDDSNYAVTLFPNPNSQSGQVVEVYPTSSGSVTVFIWESTFVDGSSSMVVSQGARFTVTGAGICKMGS